MPPKKSASKAATKPSTSTTKTTTTKKATVAKAANKGHPAKATAASQVKATSKKQSQAIDASAKSHKSKATSASAAAATKKRKAEEVDKEPDFKTKKARVTQPPVKKPKPKVVINHAPTARLNVYVCGEGSSGELGLGAAKNAVDVKRPRLNPHLPADRVGVVQVAVGGMHCVALTHDNKILTWGVNDQGALGRDTTWEGGYKDMDDNKSDADSDSDSDDDSGLNPYEATPTAVSSDAFPPETVFVEVAAGDSSSFALTDDGQVYGWGTFRVSYTRHLLPANFLSALFSLPPVRMSPQRCANGVSPEQRRYSRL
jgi:regulator of chromosome condensation